MPKFDISSIITLFTTLIGGGFLGQFISEKRQTKKDGQTDKHEIINQLQENVESLNKRNLEQMEINKSRDEKIDQMYDIINELREEVRSTRTKKEQLEFWLSVEKESAKKLQETIGIKEIENSDLLKRNIDLLSENEKLREEVAFLEEEVRQLQLSLEQKNKEVLEIWSQES